MASTLPTYAYLYKHHRVIADDVTLAFPDGDVVQRFSAWMNSRRMFVERSAAGSHRWAQDNGDYIWLDDDARVAIVDMIAVITREEEIGQPNGRITRFDQRTGLDILTEIAGTATSTDDWSCLRDSEREGLAVVQYLTKCGWHGVLRGDSLSNELAQSMDDAGLITWEWMRRLVGQRGERTTSCDIDSLVRGYRLTPKGHAAAEWCEAQAQADPT